MKQFINKLFSPADGWGGDTPKRSPAFSSVFSMTQWIWIALLIFICVAVFHYADYADTLDNAILLGESILDGEFTQYYTYAAENADPETVYTANYNIFLYGIFLIWNLPTFILHRINGFEYMQSAPSLLWCKLLVVLSVVAICAVLSRILKLYVERKDCRNLGLMMFAACSCTLIPAFVVGQYDSLALFFMLLGIYYYLKDNEKLFILFFAIAMPLKYFAIFIFLPLLLLKEKNILLIIVKTVPLFVIQFICGLPFGNDEWYGIAMGLQSRDAVSIITKSSVNIAGLTFNLFIISFLAISVFCYMRKDSGDREDRQSALYLPLYVAFASMASFSLFTVMRSYWIILLIPFAVLVMFFNRTRLRENVLLFTVSTACYSVYAFITHWIYGASGLVTFLALPRIVDLPKTSELKYGDIAGFFSYYGLTKYSQILYSVFVAGMILLLIVNFPRRSAVREWEEGGFKHEKWFSPLQILISTALIALLLYANLAVSGGYVYNVSSQEQVTVETNLIGSEITQTFTAEEDDAVEEFVFRAENTSATRQNRDIIRFELIDTESGDVLASDSMGAGEIYTNLEYRFKFPETELKAGKEYTIRLSGESSRRRSYSTFRFYASPSLLDEDHPMTADGESVEGNLVGSMR